MQSREDRENSTVKTVFNTTKRMTHGMLCNRFNTLDDSQHKTLYNLKADTVDINQGLSAKEYNAARELIENYIQLFV